MAVIVTSDTNNIMVDFGTTQPLTNQEKAKFAKTSLISVSLMNNNEYRYVSIDINDTGNHWDVNLIGGHNCLPITSVDGVVPTDLDHLYNLISSLLP